MITLMLFTTKVSDGFSAGINLRWDAFRGGKKLTIKIQSLMLKQ